MGVEAAYVFAAQLLTREVYSLGQEHPTQYHINTHTHTLSLSLSLYTCQSNFYFFLHSKCACLFWCVARLS
jgi:hypothetical protein